MPELTVALVGTFEIWIERFSDPSVSTSAALMFRGIGVFSSPEAESTVRIGASATAFTAIVAVSLLVLKAVIPPVLSTAEMSAVKPLVPLV